MICSTINYSVFTMNKFGIVSVVVTLFAIAQHQADARSALRIVNGTDAEEGEFSYVVQLYTEEDSFVCAGTILSAEWILTTASCAFVSRTVVYGTNKLNNLTAGFPNNSVEVKDYLWHPDYVVTTSGVPLYDVGLVQVASPIPLGDKVQPIKLPEANAKIPFHVQSVVAGWGYNKTEGEITQNLQKINLHLLTDDECTAKTNLFNPKLNICTDNYSNGACVGDQGDPVVINGTQYGIFSWTFLPCGIAPNAYSRLTNPEYRSWIERTADI